MDFGGTLGRTRGVGRNRISTGVRVVSSRVVRFFGENKTAAVGQMGTTVAGGAAASASSELFNLEMD